MIKENLFIVAASTPPSRGNSEYAGRKPLDRAQFRRWVYKRLPDELPPESFEAFVHNVFSRLGDEPWVGELADAFIGFHTEAISMIKNSEIGEDLPQPISYDMREEPVRVADFIKEFTDDLFGGNINLAMQSALIFYYADKILDEEERQKILEKAEKVRVEISSRISLSEINKGLEELGPEEFMAKEANRLLNSGADPNSVLIMLAGNHSETAEQIRDRLFKDKKVNVRSIAKSLAGLVSTDEVDKKVLEFVQKGKWQAFYFSQVGNPAALKGTYDYESLLAQRKDKNDMRAILLAIAGDESEQAANIRREIFENLVVSDLQNGEAGKSLIGCNDISSKAYRESLKSETERSDRNSAINLAYSVIGRTVEENTDIHNILITNRYFDELMISLVGDDSEEAWAIRDKYLHHCSDEFRARALSGLFSERAQVERQKIEDNNLYLISLNGEWEVAALRARGVIPGVRT